MAVTDKGHINYNGDIFVNGIQVLGLGYIEGFYPWYVTTTAVAIKLGSCEANGKAYYLSSDTSHAMTSLTTSFDHHYIYIDDSASTPPNPTFIDTTTQPGYSNTKRGWYNGNDRCVGSVHSLDGSAVICPFSTPSIGGPYGGKNVIVRVGTASISFIPALAGAQNPTGGWDTPNLHESDWAVPANAVRIYLSLYNTDSGASVYLGANTDEWTPATTSRGQLQSNNVDISTVEGWITLGTSKKIKISGADFNDNNLACYCKGYEYTR